jgi:hypothetical protein
VSLPHFGKRSPSKHARAFACTQQVDPAAEYKLSGVSVRDDIIRMQDETRAPTKRHAGAERKIERLVAMRCCTSCDARTCQNRQNVCFMVLRTREHDKGRESTSLPSSPSPPSQPPTAPRHADTNARELREVLKRTQGQIKKVKRRQRCTPYGESTSASEKGNHHEKR